MTEPRVPSESEVETLIGFLDQELRSGNNWSIASEYPQVFSATNRNNIRIISENEKLLAHAAIKYLLIKNTFGIFKVAAIGSVVTAPTHRNMGLSQKIIANCLQAAEQEGADIAVLWTDLYDFYRKMGFELAGTEVSVLIENAPPLNQLLSGDMLDLRFLISNKISADAILRLYSKHTCGTMRTAEDIHRFLQIPNSRVHTAWNSKNELMAYAVEGKGADLQGYIHEWGGSVPALLALVASICRDRKGPTTLIGPQSAQNLLRHLENWATLKNTGFLGMIRPVHYANLFFKISRFARNLGIPNFIIEKRADHFVVGTSDDLAIISSTSELTQLLFGPVDVNNLKPEFQKIFPIPMWIWGWDSI